MQEFTGLIGKASCKSLFRVIVLPMAFLVLLSCPTAGANSVRGIALCSFQSGLLWKCNGMFVEFGKRVHGPKARAHNPAAQIMIKLRGPLFAQAGTTVCITASNIGPGFGAKASVTGGGAIDLKIEIDLKTHTATICYTAPASGSTVMVDVSDGPSDTPETLATIIR